MNITTGTPLLSYTKDKEEMALKDLEDRKKQSGHMYQFELIGLTCIGME